jgi:hypothetical protein
MFLYYGTHGSLPLEGRGGKRANKSYLDNEDVFAACRAWLLAQKIATVTPNGFRHAINTQIMPRLLANTKKPLFPKAKKAWKPLRRSAVYIWLHRLSFYKTEEKKGIYINGHKRKDVIEYRQKDFLLKIAELDCFSIKYLEDKKGEL